jgi:hypothetical protein
MLSPDGDLNKYTQWTADLFHCTGVDPYSSLNPKQLPYRCIVRFRAKTVSSPALVSFGK